MKTEQEKAEWFQQALGMSEETMREIFEDYIGDKKMLAMSILSDAQFVLEEFDQKEQARQFMNMAKWVLSELMKQEREALDNLMSEANQDVRVMKDFGSVITN